MRFRSSRLWIAPLVGIAVAALLAAVALYVDSQFDWGTLRLRSSEGRRAQRERSYP